MYIYAESLVVKLVDTKGLKILALLGVPVRVWPRAPKMNKLKIISDKNLKSLKIKRFLLKKFKNNFINIKNLLIVIGGDGFMLQTLKRFIKKNYFLWN